MKMDTTSVERMRLLLLIPFLLISASPLFGQEKLAQTGMKFLEVSTDPRAEGMGEAFTSVEGGAESMFFNPAGMARQNVLTSISVGQVDWIADIKHVYAGVSFSPFDGDYGVFGLSFRSINYGDLQETIIANNEQGFLDVGTFSPTAYSAGLGYATALNDKFSIGGNINFVHQNLGQSPVLIDSAGHLTNKSEAQSVYSFDFGMIYKTGFKSLAFGMDVRNFSKELTYEQESFQLPLMFRLGISMNVLDMWDVNATDQSLLVSVDATHPRDYREQLNAGVEYTFMQVFSLRGGYMFDNDESGLTGGLGIRERFAGIELSIAYSYTPYGVFTNVQRFSFGASLLN